MPRQVWLVAELRLREREGRERDDVLLRHRQAQEAAAEAAAKVPCQSRMRASADTWSHWLLPTQLLMAHSLSSRCLWPLLAHALLCSTDE